MDIVRKIKRTALFIICIGAMILLAACGTADGQSDSGLDDDTSDIQVDEEG